MKLFVAILACSLVGTSLAATVGQLCTAPGDCSSAGSMCSIKSPSCNSGTCQCVPGFSYDKEADSCKMSVNIGGACKSGDLCTAEYSSCQGGSCQCNTGYKPGLKGTDCVSQLKTERYQGKCYDSVQCYYNMVCLNNTCMCYTGYKVVGDYSCQERDVGDACSNENDCSRTPNTGCSNGKCECLGGYKLVTYMTSATSHSQACIPGNEGLVSEGSACNSTVGSSGTKICSKPFVCTSCESSSPTCARVQTLYSSAVNKNAVFATTVFLIASTWVFSA